VPPEYLGFLASVQELPFWELIISRLKSLRSARAAWVEAPGFPTPGVSLAAFPGPYP